jgi:hypothetical protein
MIEASVGMTVGWNCFARALLLLLLLFLLLLFLLVLLFFLLLLLLLLPLLLLLLLLFPSAARLVQSTGAAEVCIAAPGAPPRKLKQKRPGDFFGRRVSESHDRGDPQVVLRIIIFITITTILRGLFPS